jgi:hypothetical protein
MIRKLLLIGAAAAVPAGLIVGGGVAAASGGVDATHYTVTCTTVSGSAKFSPPITSSEAAGTTKTTVKATLGGCTAVGTPTVTVTSGKTSGSFTSTSHVAGTNGCSALAGTSVESGSLTTKWKTSPKLTSGSSVTPVTETYGYAASDGHAGFELPKPGDPASGTGSFEGTDGGAGDQSNAESTVTATALLTTCLGKKGLKSFTFTTPTQGPPATHLG